MKYLIFVAIIGVANAILQECDFDESSAEQNRTGYRSGKGDDDLSTATCGKDYLMVGCDCETWPGREDDCDGAWIRDNQTGTFCLAYNGALGEGVVARARCQKIDITCSTPVGDMPYIYCPENYKLSGCTMHSSIRHNLWHSPNYHPESKRGANGCPRGMVDLIFVQDASGSFTRAEWTASIDFVKASVDLLPISSNLVKVGFVSYSTNIRDVIELNSWPGSEDIKNALSTIAGPFGKTGTRLGLDEALAMFSPSRGGRFDVRKLVVLITDGRSNIGGSPIPSADLLRDAGATVLVVGIGANSDSLKHELNGIAGDPSNVMLIDGADDLEKAQFIKNRIHRLVSCVGLCYATTGCTHCSVQARCIRVADLLPTITKA